MVARYPEGHIPVAVALNLGGHPFIEGRSFINQAGSFIKQCDILLRLLAQPFDCLENRDAFGRLIPDHILDRCQPALFIQCNFFAVLPLLQFEIEQFGNDAVTQLEAFHRQFGRFNRGGDHQRSRPGRCPRGTQRVARRNGDTPGRKHLGNSLFGHIECLFNTAFDRLCNIPRTFNSHYNDINQVLRTLIGFILQLNSIARHPFGVDQPQRAYNFPGQPIP